jgi:ankyrin repeat protein
VAAQGGKTKMVTELLHLGANPNYFTDDEGTPLAIAAKCGNTEMVECMLNAGADPNIAEFADQLPLYRARRLGDEQMIELLMEYKADPKKKLPERVTKPLQQLAMGFLKKHLSFR